MTDKFFDVEGEEKEVGTTDAVQGTTPLYGSQEWHDWIMAKFEPGELFDGNPTCAGLRRVAEEILGSIIVSRPSQVFPSTDPNGPGRATVVFEVVIDWQDSGRMRTFSDVADVWHGNTDDLFCAHPVATASTRAEGRALRKALKLRCVTAEEVTRKKDVESIVRSAVASSRPVDGEWNGDDNITEPQIKFIGSKCKQLNIDVMGFINSGESTFDTIDQVSKLKASKMLGELNKYQNKSKQIPDEILGYTKDWRQ